MSAVKPIFDSQSQNHLPPVLSSSSIDQKCSSVFREVKSWSMDDIFPIGHYVGAKLYQVDGGYHLVLQGNDGNDRRIHRIGGLNATGDLPSQLNDTYLRIHPTSAQERACIYNRLRGGIGGIIDEVFKCLFAIAMQEGAAFIAGEGSEQVTSVEVELMQGGQPIKGRYSGNMAKVKKEGCFFKKWAPYGEGKVMIGNGDWYQGLWLNGRFCNTGIYETSDGRWRYEGQWRDGERVGYGKLFTQNDRGQRVLTYEGGWKKDLFEGKGTYIKNGQEQFGLWRQGKLVEEEPTAEEAEVLATIPQCAESVLSGFHVDISQPEQAKIEQATGLALNHSIAQALGKAGAHLSVQLVPPLQTRWPLPLGMPSSDSQLPWIEVHSFDTSSLSPIVVLPQKKAIGLERMMLPKPVAQSTGYLDALTWLQRYIPKFEKYPPNTQIAPFTCWTEWTVPHQVIAVGLPVDPQKGDGAEFVPQIKMSQTLSSEGATCGYIAWAHNGKQFASECVHAVANQIIEVMTVKDKVRQSWGMQAIRSRKMSSVQFARVRDSIDHSLANALHFVFYRYIETPISRSLQSNEALGQAPATGAIVPGKHFQADTRGTYNANVYRTLDPTSLACVTVIGLPIAIEQTMIEPSSLQYCIKSHLDRMFELVQLEGQSEPVTGGQSV